MPTVALEKTRIQRYGELAMAGLIQGLANAIVFISLAWLIGPDWLTNLAVCIITRGQ